MNETIDLDQKEWIRKYNQPVVFYFRV